MSFDSFTFLWVFFPVSLLIAFLTGKSGLKDTCLLALCFLFYAWGEPKFFVLLPISATLSYFAGILMDRIPSQRKAILIASAASVLALPVASRIRYGMIPVGLSFYTFRAVSYIADIYREKAVPQRSWIKTALFISFFPQLLSGPIAKYREFAASLDSHEITLDGVHSGCRRFCFGMAKKVIIANTLGYAVDAVFDKGPELMSSCLCLLGAFAYALQIYFDFSGYSEMAAGLSEMLGFFCPVNFEHPYRSLSIREFWRRWHISLSTWFRDYLYIPLGGNRRGAVRTCVNLLIVFFATGIWHGTEAKFIVWGLYHGLFMLVERTDLYSRFEARCPAFVRRILAFLVVTFGWIIFRAGSLTEAGAFIGKIFAFSNASAYSLREVFTPSALAVFIVGAFLSFRSDQKKEFSIVVEDLSALLLFVICMILLANASHHPFIYFRF